MPALKATLKWLLENVIANGTSNYRWLFSITIPLITQALDANLPGFSMEEYHITS